MIIFPAIDIKDNKCVRLTQGDFEKVKIYEEDPAKVALAWEEKGASFLHVVDLNGAKDGGNENKKTIEKMIKEISIPVQVGGGIRSEDRVKELLDLGVKRVIIGTVAVEDKDLLRKLIHQYGERIVVSIDAKNGKVATRGWKNLSQEDSLSLCKELEEIGVQTIVYTDILKDGMLLGPNFDIYKNIGMHTKLKVIASGGISTLEDLKRLQALGIYGAIVGKAFYEERISLEEAIACLQEESSHA